MLCKCIPGHSTINCKIERIREIDAEVDDKHDVLGQIVIHEFKQAEKWELC